MMNLEEIQAIKFPDEITRYDGDIEQGQPGWSTKVTPLQMLAEIIHTLANQENIEVPVVLAGYVPGDTREIREKLNEVDAKYGIPPRKYQGHHTISLWRREWNNPEAEDELVNHTFATFYFTLEPDTGLNEWWWKKWGHEYEDATEEQVK